jgi:NAD-dependent dihydropyrimidine dehydrogenase PreA subunit
MRKDAVFIGVEVDDAIAADSAVAAKLAEVCPVDIFEQTPGGTLDIAESNLDECVLCALCMAAAPEGTVRILKLYDGEALLTR